MIKVKPKLGVVFATNDGYAMPTCVTMESVLYNNANAPESKRVDLCIYIYADEWTEESKDNANSIAKKYNVPLIFMNPQRIYERLKKIDPVPWAGTYAADVRLYVATEIDVDYNLICLDSDVIMMRGTDLYELSQFKLEEYGASCASTIDPQSSPMMKHVPKLKQNEHMYNTNGIFLVNPVEYKKRGTAEVFDVEAKKVAYAFNPYYDVIRNAYALRNHIIPLPMKYQVYPAMKGLIHREDWRFIYGLDYSQYYTPQEIDGAIDNPVFIHFVNWISRKPWNSYATLEIQIPFVDEWDFFQKRTPYKSLEKQEVEYSRSEQFKTFIYKHFYKLYIFLCAIFYRKMVFVRNRIVKKRIAEQRIEL